MFYMENSVSAGVNSIVKVDLKNFKRTLDLAGSKEVITSDSNVIMFELVENHLFILFGNVNLFTYLFKKKRFCFH